MTRDILEIIKTCRLCEAAAVGIQCVVTSLPCRVGEAGRVDPLAATSISRGTPALLTSCAIQGGSSAWLGLSILLCQTGLRISTLASHWATTKDSAASPLSPFASWCSVPSARLLPPPPSAGRFHQGKGIVSYVRYPEPPLFRPLCWCK